MKNILISPLVLLLFWTGITSAQDTLYVSLEETVASAVTGNPDILISRLEVERAISQLKAANGAFLPNIGVDGQYVRNIKRPVFFLPPGEGFGGQQGDERGTVIEAGYDNSFNMTAQATLPLYNQSIIASSRAARTAVKLQEKGLEVSENEIRAQTKKAYYDALLARESLQVLILSLENARRNLENIRNQFARELVPEYDVIRAEVQVENLRPDIFAAQNNYEASIYNLKLLTGIPQEIPLQLEESLEELYEEANLFALEQYSLEDNPQLEQLETQVALREAQIDLQEANFYPSLSAFGNYAYQAQANNFNFDEYFWVNTSSVGVQLSIPVFEGLTRLRQIGQAKIDLKQTQIQKDFQRRSLSIQAQNALNRIQRALRSLEAQEQNIAQAEKGLEIAFVSYQSGVGTLLEINDAELALTQARLNQLEAVYDFLNALADFNQITGNKNN
ncbi:TolC family protein [Salinimicrobium sp. CDJ15-81-2]|nr:TolC family protein [Salinimicrobium nanhaiense]